MIGQPVNRDIYHTDELLQYAGQMRIWKPFGMRSLSAADAYNALSLTVSVMIFIALLLAYLYVAFGRSEKKA